MRIHLRRISFLLLLLTSLVLAQEQDSLKPSLPPLPVGATDTTSLSFRDTDIREIFRALSFQHRINIFVDNTINKRVTISLNRVRVVDAMQFLCEQNGLRLQVEGGIFRIAPAPPPVVEPPPQKIPFVYFENSLLSVRLKNDILEDVVLEIQRKTGKNILIGPGVSGSLSGTLSDIDFDIGFTQLMNNNGFAIQKRNSVYTVNRLDYFVGQQTGQQQSQRSGPYWISVKDSLVTLDVTNAPLERVLTDIVRQLNADVVFYNAVSGAVTVRSSNLSLPKTLDLILRNTNFGYRESEGMFYIGERANKALVSAKLLKLKYLRAEKILDMIPQSIATQSTLKVMKEHNGIVLVAPNDVIVLAEEFLTAIDRPVAQVLIEAIVVDYDRSKGSDFGIDAGYRLSPDTSGARLTDRLIPGIDILWSGSSLNKTFRDIGKVNILGAEIGVANLGRLPGNFFLNLKALEQKGVANIKSRPLIATLNGHPASLSIGTTQYFILKTTTPYRDPTQVIFQESQQFHTIEADVKLEITPYVGADGQITVEIKPDFRTPVGSLSPDIPPTINRRALSSTLVMREGETIVLGGLIQETESETRTQTPLLGSIPLLGALFSSTSKINRKSELIIYVTPHISYGEEFQNVDLPNQVQER